jgi:hypothetical protein
MPDPSTGLMVDELWKRQEEVIVRGSATSFELHEMSEALDHIG